MEPFLQFLPDMEYIFTHLTNHWCSLHKTPSREVSATAQSPRMIRTIHGKSGQSRPGMSTSIMSEPTGPGKSQLGMLTLSLSRMTFRVARNVSALEGSRNSHQLNIYPEEVTDSESFVSHAPLTLQPAPAFPRSPYSRSLSTKTWSSYYFHKKSLVLGTYASCPKLELCTVFSHRRETWRIPIHSCQYSHGPNSPLIKIYSCRLQTTALR